MYVTVRRYEGVTDQKKVAQLVDEGFVPIISEMPGFVACYSSRTERGEADGPRPLLRNGVHQWR